jgi:hypothetical protein
MREFEQIFETRWKTQGERPLRRPRHRLEDNIKMGTKEIREQVVA